MTGPEVQRMFKINRITLYRWRKKGLIPFVEYPKTKFRYRKADVEKILQGGFTNDK